MSKEKVKNNLNLSYMNKPNQSIEELLKGFSGEDGLLIIGKYDHDLLREALQTAYESGVEDTKIKNDETIEYYQLRARKEERERIYKEQEHDHQKLMDGFSHPTDCEICKALTPSEPDNK